jgi:hypothetical protein
LPTSDGGRQRTNLLYQALSRLGDVSTVVINKTEHPITSEQREQLKQDYGLLDVLKYRKAGQQAPWSLAGKFGDQLAHLLAGWQVDYAPDPDVRDHIASLLPDFDLVVSRYLWAAAIAGVVDGPLPLIVDVDDRESERVRSSMMGQPEIASWSRLKRWWWGRRIKQLAAAEQRLLAKSQHFWLTKRQDLEGIDELAPWSLLPNIPFGSPDGAVSEPGVRSEPTILFVGSLAFSPNRNGMQRFLDHAWPTIRRACPAAQLKLVGGSAPEAWRSIPGVQCAGFVECLDQAYQEAAFSVVPLWEGAGTKIKVLESLQRSRTVVASRYALRGYEAHLHDGESLLVGDDDSSLAQSCVRILQDPALASRLASMGQRIVQEHYAQGPFDAQVARTVREVLPASA